MSEAWTAEERWLASTFEQVGLPRRLSSRTELAPGPPGRRRLRVVAVTALVALLVTGAVLLPRLVNQTPGQAITGLGYNRACQVKLPSTWTSALGRDVTRSARGLQPFAVAPNGQAYFAAVNTTAWSGVVEVNTTTGAQRRIETFSSPPPTAVKSGSPAPSRQLTEVTWGAFDGRWLVWVQGPASGRSGTSGTGIQFLTYRVMTWDSKTGQVRSLAMGRASVDPYLVMDPKPDAGVVVLGAGPGQAAFRIYSLATGRTVIVAGNGHQGAFGSAFFWSGRLVYSLGGTDISGAHWHLRAVSLKTGEPVAVPSALRSIRGASIFAADVEYATGVEVLEGQRNPPLYRVSILKRGASAPLAFTNGTWFFFGEVLFGRYLAWENLDALPRPLQRTVFVADLQTGAYAHFALPQAQFALGGGSTLLVMGPVQQSAGATWGQTVAVLHLGQLTPIGACPG